MSLLGLMWGNDTPPMGELAYNYPKNPRKNGFSSEVIIWDTVDALNAASGSEISKQMGHLGCNNRLNGPADNANSSCLSCHGTASVPDENEITPPSISQFSKTQTNECVTPDSSDKTMGTDRSGTLSKTINGVSFADMDSLYFANVPAATSFNMTVATAKGQVNVMGEGVPSYVDSQQKQWISLDYSQQLSISLKQWMQWQKHKKSQSAVRVVDKELRRD